MTLVLPQIIVEAGLFPDNPSQPGTSLRLGDAAYGKLGTGTLGTSIAWTDISDYVESFTITRPSTRVQGPLWNYQAGTCAVNLDNSDGRFDPDNLNGPYVSGGATRLKAMVPFRIRANFGSIGYPLYFGFTDGWEPADVDKPSDYATLVVSATDVFKVLAGIHLPLVSIEGVGADTGARIKDILARAGWYTSGEWQQIDTGNSLLQGTTLDSDALSLMQLAVDSEIGQFYANGAGTVVFHARRSLMTNTRSNTVQAVFDDAGPFDGFSGFTHPSSSQLLGHTEPEVKLFSGTYYCYYRDDSSGHGRINLMTSPDGISWAEQGNLVDVTAAAWDSSYVISPSVVFDGSTYYLFYEGNNGTHSQVGYASSASPSGPFTKYGSNPVLTYTGGGFESVTVGTPSVFYDAPSATYYLYYHGYDGAHDRTALAWATAPSGTWTRHPSNPVLDVTAAPWLAGKVAPSSVIVINGIVYVFIEADPGTGKFAIGVVTVPLADAKTSILSLSEWNLNAPLFSANPLGWDNDYVQLPSVISDGTPGGYWVYYSVHTLAGSFRLGRAAGFYSDGNGLLYSSVSRASDDVTIVNDVQATRAGGSNVQQAQDTASIAADLFPRTYSRTDLIVQNDSDALDWARYVLHIGSTGADRFEAIEVDPQANPAILWPQVLGRDMTDRVQVWHRPSQVSPAIVKDCFITGLIHTWRSADSSWRTKWALADASKYGSFLTLGNSALGKLGSNALAF